jgi:hypothetical protein
MKRLIMVLALCGTMVAQDVPKQEDKQDNENVEQRDRKSWPKRAWMGVQDAEWSKFDAAHKRAHSKRGDHASRGTKKHKSGWVRKAVAVVVIGGIGYYIGVNDRKHYRKGGFKRPTK